MTFKLMNAVW